ncbi:MAG: hypothetical protein IJA01_03040 [Firmicutes bacterium]|nr:hypothetical protein [Bacillota bacterium]MBQ4596073.1 hypothetical protein [Bacillota bacterium]
MKTRKEKTFELLDEVIAACEASDIRYVISGELALRRVEGTEVPDNFNNAAVAVFARDIDKLCAALSKREDRHVESLANNSRFPGFYVRYTDPSTTLFNYTEPAFTYDVNAFGVNIEIICSIPKINFRRRILSQLKVVFVTENAPYYMDSRHKSKSINRALCMLFFKLFKDTSVMAYIYRKWIRVGSIKRKKYEIATIRGYIAEFKESDFKEENRASFVSKYFGKDKRIKPTYHEVYDLEVPCRKFSQAIDEHDLPLKEYQKHQQKFLKWQQEVYFPMRKIRRKHYNYMFCAEDRMLMYKEFDAEKKQLVMDLYDKGNYEELREILAGYIDNINKYHKDTIGFCSDHEIFRVALSTMLWEISGKTGKPSAFKRRSRKIINIIKNTQYAHMDSVENVFWGDREDSAVLKQRKAQILKDIEQEITCIISTKTSKI